MNQSLKAKMDNLAFQKDSLIKELKLEPDNDSRFCAGKVGSCLATLNMAIENPWGKRLEPKPLGYENVTVPIDPEDNARLSQAPATPKAKK